MTSYQAGRKPHRRYVEPSEFLPALLLPVLVHLRQRLLQRGFDGSAELGAVLSRSNSRNDMLLVGNGGTIVRGIESGTFRENGIYVAQIEGITRT